MRTIYAVITFPDYKHVPSEATEIVEFVSRYLKEGLPHLSPRPAVTCYDSATELAANHIDYLQVLETAIDNVADMAEQWENGLDGSTALTASVPTVGSEMVRLLSDPSINFDSQQITIYETVEEPFKSDGYTVTVVQDRSLPPTADFVEMWNNFLVRHLIGTYELKSVRKQSKTYTHFRRK